MENILTNAKFGDKFLTRNGKIALFLEKEYKPKTENTPELITIQLAIKEQIVYDDRTVEYASLRNYYNESGKDYHDTDEISDYDIVSKYVEPINENELREKAFKWTDFVKNDNLGVKVVAVECAMVGYRKAKAGE